MPQYLLLVLRPHGFDHAKALDDAARGEIDALNAEMKIAGIRTFVGGLRPTGEARTLAFQAEGSVIQNAGSVIGGSSYLDGLWILDCDGIEEALCWGRKAASACRASIEVRPFY